MVTLVYDVIIVGSGPAGLTSAVYCGRALLKTLVIAGSVPGGQLMLTTEVENFPGFEEPILGPDLIQHMRKQAERFGAEFIQDDAMSVDFKTRPLKVSTAGKTYEASAVIIATGASAKWLGLDSETRLRGKGVSSCATCDGFFFRGKDTVTVGGGDVALEDTMFLTKFANHATIIHRRDALRASKILQDRASKNSKISFVWDSVVEEVLGQQKVEGVRVRNVKTGKQGVLKCDGVFVAIGHEPNTAIFQGQVELDQKGYIVTRQGTATSVECVFACGDVRDFHYRQAITAAGDGCRAAMDAEDYIEEKGLRGH
ncbi:MAG: thioredoxin-disulfide reductase [Candidatus Bathyarchaeia archaeon]|jgi:thioredoxin reductase (NADPH)